MSFLRCVVLVILAGLFCGGGCESACEKIFDSFDDGDPTPECVEAAGGQP